MTFIFLESKFNVGLSLEDSTTSTHSFSVEEDECEKCIQLKKQICVLKAELDKGFWLFYSYLNNYFLRSSNI